VKQPLVRLADRQDKTGGTFFEQRSKSVAILDDESLLATCASIDLNPVAAGIAETPRRQPAHLHFIASRTRQATGPNRGPSGRWTGQRSSAERVSRPRRINLALPDRRPQTLRFHA
jgi:hypothetical protein